MHNAIVHNLPEQGTVWVTTSVHPKSVVLTVENTGKKLAPQLVSTLTEPFQRGAAVGVEADVVVARAVAMGRRGAGEIERAQTAGRDGRANDLHHIGIGKIFQEYYAAVPEGVVNDRWHVPHHGYRTSEYQFMLESEDAQAWENCRGIGFSFGYNANEEKESLDSRGVIRHLVDVASRGGHLLLGVGPKADGSLPEFQQRVLTGMATWMAEAGNTLGGLRPSRESFAALASPGFIREGQTNSSHYVYVDSDYPVESVLLQTTKKPSLLPGSFASLKQVDAGYLVELGPNRNGPAVLELR